MLDAPAGLPVPSAVGAGEGIDTENRQVSGVGDSPWTDLSSNVCKPTFLEL